MSRHGRACSLLYAEVLTASSDGGSVLKGLGDERTLTMQTRSVDKLAARIAGVCIVQHGFGLIGW